MSPHLIIRTQKQGTRNYNRIEFWTGETTRRQKEVCIECEIFRPTVRPLSDSMRWGALGLAFRLELGREVRIITIPNRCLLRFG